jgi:hypothetical protein
MANRAAVWITAHSGKTPKGSELVYLGRPLKRATGWGAVLEKELDYSPVWIDERFIRADLQSPASAGAGEFGVAHASTAQ